MNEDNDQMLFVGLGPLAAVLLGMLLVPLRGATTASNLAYLFLALTIAVAEFGGQRAALATALSAALSLDFFLTQPYLHLEIAEKNDIIAFAGLALCGLVAAALGAKRGERLSDLHAVRKHQRIVHAALVELQGRGALDLRATRMLDACRSGVPVSDLVLRDNRNNVVAAWPDARPAPTTVLGEEDRQRALLQDSDLEAWAAPLPREGIRLGLESGGRQVGWLDVWGSGAAASADSRRVLFEVASVLAALLATSDADRR